ncbi:DUF3630 family protein [Thalassotalea profundi]|uniref:DUF3630 family protein n=1 Tax=Thalassotalea profundi TaxID=2036687 RepID=A0ABQ3IME9_9GAMM|nr:DUF3630 family protein [Thalassotalea profundi]GHE88663.1 hypothetical protein GCM10011501_17610 [Thalassotalea profundi]
MSHNYLKNVIKRIVLDDTYEIIDFQIVNFTWQSEEIIIFTRSFFQLLTNLHLIETIDGADRHSLRFSYQNNEFILNIECICESIWIDAYATSHKDIFSILFQEIKSQLLQDLP